MSGHISQQDHPYYPIGKRAGYLRCDKCGYHHDIKTEPCVPAFEELWNRLIDLKATLAIATEAFEGIAIKAQVAQEAMVAAAKAIAKAEGGQ